jgi:hypothetical protein
MYTFATLVALGFGAPALAQDASPELLDVGVSSTADSVRIDFQTVDPQPAMCELRVNRLVLDAPRLDDSGRVADGSIRIRAGVDPNEICPQVVGPERGAVVLEKGRDLPELQVGRYQLEINGQMFGVLEVGDNGARLLNPVGI